MVGQHPQALEAAKHLPAERRKGSLSRPLPSRQDDIPSRRKTGPKQADDLAEATPDEIAVAGLPASPAYRQAESGWGAIASKRCVNENLRANAPILCVV